MDDKNDYKIDVTFPGMPKKENDPLFKLLREYMKTEPPVKVEPDKVEPDQKAKQEADLLMQDLREILQKMNLGEFVSPQAEILFIEWANANYPQANIKSSFTFGDIRKAFMAGFKAKAG